MGKRFTKPKKGPFIRHMRGSALRRGRYRSIDYGGRYTPMML
jgi:hypothetical protein